MSKCEISLPPTNGSHRDVNGGGPSPEHGHMPQPTPLILDRRRVASSQKLLLGETSASHMHRGLGAVVDLLRLAVSQIPSFSAVCTL